MPKLAQIATPRRQEHLPPAKEKRVWVSCSFSYCWVTFVMSVTSLTLSFLTGKMSLSAAVRMKEIPVWKVLWDVLGAGPHTEHGP